MNSQDLHNLQEAYLDVYGLDEEKRPFPFEKVEAKKEKVKKGSLYARSKGDSSPVSDSEMEATRRFNRMSVSSAAATRNKTQKEQTDLYDIILSHLLDEGYAETQEQAEVIMVNMSEDWRESICEAMVDSGLTGQEKKKIRNERNFGTNTLSKSKSTKERHKKHREIRGMKKIKGDKTGEKESSILSQSSRVHKSYNNGYNRDGSYMG